MNDLYETLGVDKNATQQEIKESYRELAKKHHPDKTGKDDGRFAEISDAYQTLSDPDSRERYDKDGHTKKVDNFIMEMIDKIQPVIEHYSKKGKFTSDPVEMIKDSIIEHKIDFQRDILKKEQEIKSLEKIKSKFVTDSDEPNVFELSIQSQINSANSLINSIKDAIAKLDRFKLEIDKYKFTGEIQTKNQSLNSLLNDELFR